MYVRITYFHVYESKLSEIERRLARLCTQIEEFDGLIKAHAAWRDDGQCISIAFYEDESFADMAALEIQSMWASLDDLLSAPIQVSTYDTAMPLTFGS